MNFSPYCFLPAEILCSFSANNFDGLTSNTRPVDASKKSGKYLEVPTGTAKRRVSAVSGSTPFLRSKSTMKASSSRLLKCNPFQVPEIPLPEFLGGGFPNMGFFLPRVFSLSFCECFSSRRLSSGPLKFCFQTSLKLLPCIGLFSPAIFSGLLLCSNRAAHDAQDGFFGSFTYRDICPQAPHFHSIFLVFRFSGFLQHFLHGPLRFTACFSACSFGCIISSLQHGHNREYTFYLSNPQS